jgi:hypothetical protein
VVVTDVYRDQEIRLVSQLYLLLGDYPIQLVEVVVVVPAHILQHSVEKGSECKARACVLVQKMDISIDTLIIQPACSQFVETFLHQRVTLMHNYYFVILDSWLVDALANVFVRASG